MENIIPLQKNIYTEKMIEMSGSVNDFIENFEKVLSPFIIKNIKKEQKAREIEETYYQQQLKLNTLKQEKVITNTTYRYLKLRTTWAKYLDKLRQKKWFDKVLGGLKGLAEKGSNWFFDLIKTLLILSLFPGLADMFFSIINTIIQFAIRLLIKYIPIVIKEFIRIITQVLPKFIKSLGHGILDALSIPKDHPLRQLVDALAKASPYIFAIWGIFSIFYKYAPIIMGVFKVFAFLFKGVFLLFSALKWVFIILKGILLVFTFIIGVIGVIPALIIGAIVLFGILIYKFRDQILNFIKQIPQWIIGLAKKVSVLFTKLWINVKKYFNTFTSFIKKWMGKFFDFLLYPYKKLWNTLKGLFSKISENISFDAIKKNLENAIKNLPNNLLSAFGNLKNAIKKKIDELAPLFLELFYQLQARLSALTELGGTRSSQASYIASYISSVKGLNIDQDDFEDYLKGKKSIQQVAPSASNETLKTLQAMKKMFDSQVTDKTSYGDLLEIIKNNLKTQPQHVTKVERKKK